MAFLAARTIEWSFAFLFLLAPIAAVILLFFILDPKSRQEFRDIFSKKKEEDAPGSFSWHSTGKPYAIRLSHTYLEKKAEELFVTANIQEKMLTDILCGALFWTESCKGDKARETPISLSLSTCQWILWRFCGCKTATRTEYDESKDRVDIDLFYEKEKRKANQGPYVVCASPVLHDNDFQELAGTYDIDTQDSPLELQDKLLVEQRFWKAG